MVDNKRSVGIWIYGGTFLIVALALLTFSLMIGSDGTKGGCRGEYGLSCFVAAVSMLLVLFFMLLGTLIALRKFRLVILILLSLLIVLTIPFYYFSLVTTPYLIMINLFLISAFYFFTRPMIKKQFR